MASTGRRRFAAAATAVVWRQSGANERPCIQGGTSRPNSARTVGAMSTTPTMA
jgi:hypothetical protein